MLGDVRVVDLSTDVAGAYGTRLLASYGADVIKVEAPEGDPLRRRAPRFDGSAEGGLLFAYLNGGKRSVTVDAGAPEDLERLRALLATADGVVESGAPGEWRGRGVDFGALRAERPDLVVCSVTPYGQSGPRAGWRATALTAYAAGGQMYLTGEPDRPPLKTAGHQAYYQGGLHVFSSVLTALLAARRTGAGDWIDLSLQEAQASSLEGAGPAAMVREVDGQRSGNFARAIWGIYPSADGYIGVASMARQAAAVYRCIGQEHLAEIPDLILTQNEMVQALILEWTTARTSLEIYRESEKFRAPFALIPTPRDLLEWEPLRENGFWQEVDHPHLGRYTLPSGPFTVNGSRSVERRAPLLGEHTAEVFAEVPARPAPAATEPAAPPATPRARPLDGVRVLDFSQVWAGPYGTMFLGDMGADVIHVEGPAFPDVVRGIVAGEAERPWDRSSYFNLYNRNKRSLVLDIHTREGREAVRRLVAQVDVVVENWSAGVAERNGLSYEELRAINPRVVFLQMPGFGNRGPDATRVGFGPTIEQSGGLVALQGYEDGPPQKSGISYGDPTAGVVAAGAVALALLERERTGEGAHLVLAQRDNVIGLVGEYLVAESLGCPVPVRIGNRDLEYAPHNVYRCRDGEPRPIGGIGGTTVGESTEEWLALAVDGDEAWAALRRCVGDARLDAPEYDTAAGRLADSEAIDAVLAEWAAGRVAGEAAAALQAAGVAASVVLSPLMLTRDEHLAARGFYVEVDHPVAGRTRLSRSPWRLAERNTDIARPAPCFGEHNRDVLADLGGYTQDEIDELARAGVIADAPR